MTVTRTRTTDWSGGKFGAPNPFLLTKSWRIKHGFRLPEQAQALYYYGQDGVDAAGCGQGLPVYAGYFNGFYANLGDFRRLFPDAKFILSVTPDGMKGARCVDCEPGDATPQDAAVFVRDNQPEAEGGGKNDAGKPMVYCSAGDAQAVIDACAALGFSRDKFLLFTAHWVGQHICSPSACGYPAADATQYASNNAYDSDVFYAYCFGPPLSQWPLRAGSTGPDVKLLQERLNAWREVLVFALLAEDGDFGPDTEAAVVLAQLHFWFRSADGECTAFLYALLAKAPPSPADWTYLAPVIQTVRAGRTSVYLAWDKPSVPGKPDPAGYEVVIYNDPPVLDDKGHWKVVESRYADAAEYQAGSLDPGHYQAHVWAVGSPVTSDGNYATAKFVIA